MNDNDPLSPAGVELSAFLKRQRDQSTNHRKSLLKKRRSQAILELRNLNAAYFTALPSIAILKICVLFGYPLAIAIFLEQLWGQHTLSFTSALLIAFAHILAAAVDVLEREIATIQLLNSQLVSYKPARLSRKILHERYFRRHL